MSPRTAADARLYGNQLGRAWDRVWALVRAAPANGAIRVAASRIAGARGWPRKAEAEAQIAESLVPLSLGGKIALIEAAVANFRFAEADRRLAELIALYPEDLAVRRIAGQLDAQHRWLVEVEARPSNSTGGGVNQAGRGLTVAARLFSPPIAGEFFGEGCLIGQPLRLATAKAMVESVVMRVGKAEMMRLLHAEPTFGEMFMAHLLIRNSRVEEDLVDQLFNSSEKRLARTLLILANFGKHEGPQPITTPITQETLAEIIGTTRPRVSHFMNKFRKLGFITYNGHLQVHGSLLSVVLRDNA